MAIPALLSACEEGPTLGAFSAAWAITRGGAAIGCSEVGVFAVEVEAADAEGTTYISRFPCELGAAVTAFMPPGDYRVTQRIVDQGLSPIGEPTPVMNEALLAGHVVDLVTVTFEMAP